MSDSSTSNNTIFTRPLQQQDEEETTTFRSIPLGSAAAMRPLPAMSMPRGLAPLAAGKRSLGLPPKPSAVSPATTSSTKSSTFSWKLEESSIPSMPDYPLERTHMTCSASLSLEQVSQRIAHVLESQSLSCVFPEDQEDDEEDILPGRVDCSSLNSDLKLVVQLYKNDAGAFVVEAQRRRGSAFDFSAVRKPLFHMLTTGKDSTGPKPFTPPSIASFAPNEKLRIMPATPVA